MDNTRRRRLLRLSGLGVLLAIQLGASARAQAPQSAAEVFKGADLALGERLIAEHKCSACHARKVGGDGAAIYKPTGRINTPSALRGMVDYCSTELNLGLFPEDVTSVAAVLQRDHYRFGLPGRAAAGSR
jgi:hypothetical protein